MMGGYSAGCNLESEGKPPTVRVQKPQGRATKTARQKECATCGQVFDLQPGQKFFDCPDCYQNKMTEQRLAGAKRTRVLTRIECRDCGAQEFVTFVPEDPATVLCRACFARQARERKEQRERWER
jgi:CxxC-x17-CxxC domain-containing protein